MKIFITADPNIPVPPKLYGGIERIIYELIDGLSKKGHEIILMANKDSDSSCELVPYNSPGNSYINTFNNINILSNAVKYYQPDIVHSFGRMAYLFNILRSDIPKIQTYQRYITPKSLRLANLFGAKNLTVTACSQNCLSTTDMLKFNSYAVHNFVDVKKYNFSENKGDDHYLLFLGRLDPIKGAHTAIQTANKTGNKLVIAGNCTKESENYFKNEIKPHIDGENITYFGPVNDEQKDKLIGGASALLFPIEWEEPFGIVMAESLACGTPVIAYNRGAVPEVIENGVNGYRCENIDDFIKSVGHIDNINRSECRKTAERKFSKEVIVGKYEEIYYKLLEDR